MSEETNETGVYSAPEVIDLDGIFSLHRSPDGTVRAEYGRLTAPRELSLRWKLQPEEGELALAFLFLSERIETAIPTIEVPTPKVGLFASSNLSAMLHAANTAKAHADFFRLILSKFRSSIGAELELLANPSTAREAKENAKTDILKRVSNALSALAFRSDRKPHGSTAFAEVTLTDGETRQAKLAWITLETARQLVAETHRLPAKGEIQLRIGEQFPEFLGLGKTTWRNTWKECGLATLDQGSPWEFEERKKAARAKAKKFPRTKKP